jgi:hypothetical protein
MRERGGGNKNAIITRVIYFPRRRSLIEANKVNEEICVQLNGDETLGGTANKIESYLNIFRR